MAISFSAVKDTLINWFHIWICIRLQFLLEGLLQVILSESATSDLANNWTMMRHISPEHSDDCATGQYFEITPVWVAHTKTILEVGGHTLPAVACFCMHSSVRNLNFLYAATASITSMIRCPSLQMDIMLELWSVTLMAASRGLCSKAKSTYRPRFCFSELRG